MALHILYGSNISGGKKKSNHELLLKFKILGIEQVTALSI